METSAAGTPNSGARYNRQNQLEGRTADCNEFNRTTDGEPPCNCVTKSSHSGIFKYQIWFMVMVEVWGMVMGWVNVRVTIGFMVRVKVIKMLESGWSYG